MVMEKMIEWQRDIRGEEPELLDGRAPVGAVPQNPGTGTLTTGHLVWSYKKGEQTCVLLKSEDSRKYSFLDIKRGHQISEIPQDAFRFIN
jgi:hypothetical protein